MIIKPNDIFPHAGCRDTILWFRKHGLDWDGFRERGIELDRLIETGEHLEKIHAIADNAKRRIGRG